jgi:hypothetical protein
MAEIEKIAADRYRVRSHGHLITLSAQDLLDVYEYVLLDANTLPWEAIASKDEQYTEEETHHAHELMETGITDITGLVMRRLEEE